MLYCHYIKLKAVKINIVYVICGTLQVTAARIKYSLHFYYSDYKYSVVTTYLQLLLLLQKTYFCCAAGITELVTDQHSTVNSVTLR